MTARLLRIKKCLKSSKKNLRKRKLLPDLSQPTRLRLRILPGAPEVSEAERNEPTMQAPTHNTPYHSRREERAPRKVNWWLRVTSSGWDKPQETIEQRESTRRSQLLSWILLGECVALAGFIPTVFTSLPALAMILIAAFTMLIVIWLNRTGLIVVAGILQVIVSISVTFGVLLASPDGAL